MNLSKSWDLQIDHSVLKTLQKIPCDIAENIIKVIRFLPINPYFGDIQKMKGEKDTWRRRIGSYRIFYKIKNDDKIILIFDLERRTSKTY